MWGVRGWAIAPLLAIVLAGCAGQAAGTAQSWYAKRGSVAPRSDKVVICHGFGCAYRTPVAFSAKDLRTLKAIIARGAASPKAERAALGKAVQWQEKRVAPLAGSGNDKGGLNFQSGVRGQMDCIDEATNTTSLLLIAEKHGFLKYHDVRSPVARGFFLDGRYPHATAVVAEMESRHAFAIDSWTHDNGVAPDIMPLDTWLAQYPSS